MAHAHCWQGDFVMGKKEGLGKMTFSNGEVQEGNWKADVFIN